jgi:hypothetical protein
MMTTAAFIGLLAAAPAGGSSSLVGVPVVSGASETDVFGVNDGNPTIITGSWYDTSDEEHGYFGPMSTTAYTTFDDSTDPGTEPRGINDGGYITGFDNSESGSAANYIPFERAPDGTITNVTMGGTTLNDLIQGISNKKNVFAGSYVNSSLEYLAYIGTNGQYSKGIKLKGITNTGYAARGINDKGDIVGWYYDTNGVQNGFLLSRGTAVTIDDPDTSAVSTVLEGINDAGTITGQWTNKSKRIFGFIYDIGTKKFTPIRVPSSSSFVQPWGISGSGLVAVGSDVGYYVWCPSTKVCVKYGGIAAGGPPQRPAHRLSPKLP